MIKSSLDDMLMGRQSRYALVIAVAKEQESFQRKWLRAKSKRMKSLFS